MSNAFIESTLAAAMQRFNNAAAYLEEHADNGSAKAVGDAYRNLMMGREHLRSAVELMKLSTELESPPTERPSSMKLSLQVVR